MTRAEGRRGAKAYFGALGVAQICALLRYMVLARLLGPEQLGLAAIIILTAQFFDSITEAGNDRFLIQDRDGDSEAALKLVQLVSLGRGLGIAIALLLLAGPIAKFSGAPQVESGLRWLALVPLIAAGTHFDFRRLQRAHDFRPEGKVLLASETLSLAATATAAFLTRDFTAILYGLAARSFAQLLVSHLTARRQYRLGYSPDLARRLWRFGGPLLANGLLLFLATQSDRIIVSRALGVAELGRYSALVLLVYYPIGMIMRYVAAVGLPGIAAAANSPSQLILANRQLSGACFLLATIIALGFAGLATPLLPLVFGTKFQQPSLIVTLVGIHQVIRLIKVAPTTVALGTGRTNIVLINNVIRISTIPLALLGYDLVGRLEGVILGFILGELLANLSATLLLNRKVGWGEFRDIDRYFLFCATFGSLVLAAWSAQSPFRSAGFVIAGGLVIIWLWRERAELLALRRW